MSGSMLYGNPESDFTTFISVRQTQFVTVGRLSNVQFPVYKSIDRLHPSPNNSASKHISPEDFAGQWSRGTWFLDIHFQFINQLNSVDLFSAWTWRKNPLKQRLNIKERKELQSRMSKVFTTNISGLSTELQKILLDDLVTAFQNRINVLNRAQAKGSY